MADSLTGGRADRREDRRQEAWKTAVVGKTALQTFVFFAAVPSVEAPGMSGLSHQPHSVSEVPPRLCV